jgi:hypothetical protein
MDIPFDDICCGKCKYHKNDDGGWICSNENSEYYTDYTAYNDCCSEAEERE